MIDSTFTALFAFGGSGGVALGFIDAHVRLLGRTGTFKCLGSIDNDPVACVDFERFTGTPAWCVDVRDVTGAELRARYGTKAPHVVVGSPPCLPGHGPVLTPDGPRAIETLRANDMVLTHKGRYRPVKAVGTHEYTGEMFGFRLNGTIDTQEFTAEHPLWVRRDWKPLIDGKQRARRGPPKFAAARDVRVGDRIGFPIDAEVVGTAKRFIDALGDPQVITRGGNVGDRCIKHQAEMRMKIAAIDPDSPDLWFLVGAYLGDGYRRPSRYETIFCVGPEDGPLALRIRDALARVGIDSVGVDRHGGRGNVKLRIHARHLSMICGAFGDGAEQKRIPHSLMALERPLLDALVAGHRATDGSERVAKRAAGGKLQSERWKIVSISLGLLRDLQRLLLRRGEFGAIHVAWPGGPQTIMGRTVNTRPRWEVTVTKGTRRGVHDFIDGAVWVRIRSIKKRQTVERVWNIEVDEDNTFCAPMMATHNCKGSSRLITQAKADTEKYVAMNQLALVWTRAMLDAWGDDPPALYLIENVAGLPHRAAGMLRELRAMLRKHGYVFHARSHNAGELGGLAQNRERYLLVARHPKKCPSLLYQPPKRRVRGVGEELCKLPMPATVGAGIWGAQHTLPKLSWRNWVRLALIPAGGDWRDLDGVLQGRARREVFRRHAVQAWDQPIPAVTGPGGHSVEAVADPRFAVPSRAWGGDDLGVTEWSEPSATINGKGLPRTGRYSVADPRFEVPPGADWHENKLAVIAFDQPAPTVIGKPQPSSGGIAVADLRVRTGYDAAYGVLAFDQPARTVTGKTAPGNNANTVADPRARNGFADNVVVLTLDEAMALDLDPIKAPPFIPVIVAEDGTWHRPMTLLELALLQSYPLRVRGEQLHFAGTRTQVAEHVGNSIPPDAARAIAEQMLIALVEELEGAMLLRGDGAVWVTPAEART